MRLFVLAICLNLCASYSVASTETPKTASEKATLALKLARQGEYGRLSDVHINMLQESRNRIEQLARDNASFDDFDKSELRKFESASERINRLTRRTDAKRMVCKKVVKTGTRLVESECLTVAQREARAKGSKERTEQLLRGGCSNENPLCSGGG